MQSASNAGSDQLASTIEALIHDLSAPRWETRRKAADSLVELGSQAVPSLIEALQQKAFTPYGGYLLAIEVLGKIGDQRAVDLLITVMPHDGHVRKAAAEALGRIGDARAITPLIETFRMVDEDDETTTIEAWGLASQALGKIGEPALLPLIAALKDLDESVRAWSADALGKLRDPRAVPALLHALNDPNLHVRLDAAEALGKIGDSRACAAIVNLLQEKEHILREYATRALRYLHNCEVLDVLVGLLADSDIGVSCQAAYALGERRDLRAIPPLVRAAQDDNPQLRAAAAQALGYLGDESVLPLLERMASHDRGMAGANPVKQSAEYAINRIRQRLAELNSARNTS